MSTHLPDTTMSTVLAILANIDRIENSWNGQSSQLSAWCTEARGFVESEIIGKLGSRLGKTATGHTSYIFPREVFEIVNEWFANLASETGPLKSIQDPRDLPILKNAFTSVSEGSPVSAYDSVVVTVKLWTFLFKLLKGPVFRSRPSANGGRRTFGGRGVPGEQRDRNAENIERYLRQARADGIYSILIDFSRSLTQNWDTLDASQRYQLYEEVIQIYSEVTSVRQFKEILAENRDYAISLSSHSRTSKPQPFLEVFGRIAGIKPTTRQPSGWIANMPSTRPPGFELEQSLPSFTPRKRSIYRITSSL